MRNVIVLFFVMSVLDSFGMEVEDERQMPIIPLEVLMNFNPLKNAECIRYTMDLDGYRDYCALPWTVAPFFLKYCTNVTSIDTDLTNPQPGDKVLPNAQLWTTRGNEYRLSEDSRRTNDIFFIAGRYGRDSLIYDGINKNDKAMCACKWDPDTSEALYELCMFTQSSEFGKKTKTHNHKPLLTGQGTLRSLMLENERDVFMYSVDCGNSLYKLIREDLIQSDPNLSRENCCNKIVLLTKELFTKTVCLGKDTYLGITDTGKLYSLWLNDKGSFECAEQKFSACPHTFKDISIDNTVSTQNGFKQKIALLTTEGEIYVTHLDAYLNAQPTLFYITTIEEAVDVKRLFYNDGKLSVIYQDERAVLVWQDNFELLYLCALLKKQYDDVFS